MWTCSSCKTENEDYSLFCKKCNTSKPSAASAAQPASPPAAPPPAPAQPAAAPKSPSKAPYVAGLADYLRGSATAGLLETASKVFLYAGIVIGVLAVIVLGGFGKEGYSFLLGLTGGLCVFGAFYAASLLFKGLSGMAQSIENIESMTRYTLEHGQSENKSKAS